MPVANNKTGIKLRWCLRYPCKSENEPIANASKIIKYSKAILLIMLIPKTGRLEITKGKTAQWIAQATEALIPNASQLNLLFIRADKDIQTQQCCKNFFLLNFEYLVVVNL